MSQPIWYSMIHGSNYDFGKIIMSHISERLTENRTKVYYARFVQLIF